MFTRALLRGGMGAGVPALAGTVVLAAACASGGGRPAMTAAEAEALLGDYSGIWVLDQSGSSPPTDNPVSEARPGRQVISSGNRTVILEEGSESLRSSAIRHAMFEVLRGRPETLSLRVDGITLVYTPSPGQSIEMPMSGGSASRTVRGQIVRTRLFMEEGRLGFEHALDVGRLVQEVLEIVEGRLKITRTIVRDRDVDPVVLVFDRGQPGS